MISNTDNRIKGIMREDLTERIQGLPEVPIPPMTPNEAVIKLLSDSRGLRQHTGFSLFESKAPKNIEFGRKPRTLRTTKVEV